MTNRSRFVMPEIILEGSRNSTLFTFGCSLRSDGEGGTIPNILRAVNEHQCSPPLPDREVQRIAESVLKYPAGYSFKTLEPLDEPLRSWLGYLQQQSDILETPEASIEWDAESILERNSSPALWYGESGVFKSFLALHVATCMVTGEPVFGKFAVKKRQHAIYVNLDAGKTSFENRVRAIRKAVPGLLIVKPDEWSIKSFELLLLGFREAFVVLDCWSDIYQPNPGIEQGSDMRRAVKEIRDVFERNKCGGIVIDHSKRSQAGYATGSRENYYGSVQKRATFRQMTFIERIRSEQYVRGQARVKLSCTKMSEAEEFGDFYVDVKIENGRSSFIYTGDVTRDSNEVDRLAQMQKAIVDHLRSIASDTANSTALAEVAGTSKSNPIFKLALKHPEIGQVGRGKATRYRYVERAPMADLLKDSNQLGVDSIDSNSF